MSPRKTCTLLASLCLLVPTLPGQATSPRDRLASAHAQYYNLTTAGVKTFHCDAAIDWKTMLSRFSGTDIADDNPTLKHLQTVHLGVTDDLKGAGALEWTTSATPPEGKEQAMQQIEEGLKISLGGFFQSWNAYMNGTMVPVPDSTITFVSSGDGFHLSGKSGDMNFDEDYDKNMLLTQVLIDGPALKVLTTPTYNTTSDGLVISSIHSQINQPPTAPQTEATFRVEYATVQTFQLPSRIVLDIKNTGVIDVGLSACQVTLADWAKKP